MKFSSLEEELDLERQGRTFADTSTYVPGMQEHVRAETMRWQSYVQVAYADMLGGFRNKVQVDAMSGKWGFGLKLTSNFTHKPIDAWKDNPSTLPARFVPY